MRLPYPNGWYLFAFSNELPRGGLLSRPFMGQEVVVFRTASGRASAVDATCPHLGAHFAYGGRVEGEALRCPFHGFCFDAEGTCVRTGYGTRPPPLAKLRTWPLCEQDGLLLVYYHAQAQPPAWFIPPLNMEGWTPVRYRKFILHDHPQETTENSVDLGHFAFVHGYRSAHMLHDAVLDGPALNTAYSVRRGIPGLERLLPGRDFEFRFETHIYGLGYSRVEVTIPFLRAHGRLWVLPTSLDEERISLYLAASLKAIEPGAIHPALKALPAGLVSRLVAGELFRSFVHDTQQDFPIWEHKKYVSPPALAEGDGPIGKYRQWAKQFYEG